MSTFSLILTVTELPNGELGYSYSIDGPSSPSASSLVRAFTAAASDLAAESVECAGLDAQLSLVG